MDSHISEFCQKFGLSAHSQSHLLKKFHPTPGPPSPPTPPPTSTQTLKSSISDKQKTLQALTQKNEFLDYLVTEEDKFNDKMIENNRELLKKDIELTSLLTTKFTKKFFPTQKLPKNSELPMGTPIGNFSDYFAAFDQDLTNDQHGKIFLEQVYQMSFLRNALMANSQKLQLSLIMRVAGQIWQILQISAVIRRILQIPRGSANSKPKFHSQKLAKVCSQKFLLSESGSRTSMWVITSSCGL